jgi:rhomboid protease GluP
MSAAMSDSLPNGAAGDDGTGDDQPLRASRSRARMSDWSLVLDSADIAYQRIPGVVGWELRVAAADQARARQALDAYDQESARPEVPVIGKVVESYGRTWIGAGIALALTAFFIVTGPSDGVSSWSRLGSSASVRIFQGEVWRVVTALTLHVDPSHLLGNALACLVFITLLGNALGPGLASWLVLLAGAFGNLLTAAVTRGHHVSVGASTATFGALGGLVGMRVTSLHQRFSKQPAWLALAAGAALLGMLGTSPGADVLAHFFGLLCGALLGAGMVLAGAPLRSRWGQWLLAVGALCGIALCWVLAFERGLPI